MWGGNDSSFKMTEFRSLSHKPLIQFVRCTTKTCPGKKNKQINKIFIASSKMFEIKMNYKFKLKEHAFG